MSDDDLTVHVLIGLRNEIRSTNQRIDRFEQELRTDLGATHAELTATRAELTAARDQLAQQIVEVELRLATRFTEQTAATRDLYDLLNTNLQLRDRVERCEHDLAELRDRVV